MSGNSVKNLECPQGKWPSKYFWFRLQSLQNESLLLMKAEFVMHQGHWETIFCHSEVLKKFWNFVSIQSVQTCLVCLQTGRKRRQQKRGTFLIIPRKCPENEDVEALVQEVEASLRWGSQVGSDCYAVMFSLREHCYVARQKGVF